MKYSNGFNAHNASYYEEKRLYIYIYIYIYIEYWLCMLLEVTEVLSIARVGSQLPEPVGTGAVR